ncbi:DUF6266 family protein [Prolixibacteraceae bacterium]|nr:DUF6266 family protein [Prolixibacteraceae bacterium]
MARVKGKYISGLIGNLVMFRRGNKQFVRSRPDRTKKPASIKQKNQRMRLKLSVQFLSGFKEVIRVSYRERSKDAVNAMSLARSHIMLDAIKGFYPNQYIDCSEVKMCAMFDTQISVGNIWYDGVHLKVDVDVEHNSIRDGFLVILRYSSHGGDISDMVKLRARDHGKHLGWQTYETKWKYPVRGEEVHFWAMTYDPYQDLYSESCYFSCYLTKV